MAEIAPAATSLLFIKIAVDDIERATDFFVGALSLKVLDTYELPELVERTLAGPGQENGPFFVLYKEHRERALSTGNRWGPIGFAVPDVDAAYARAIALGGAVDRPPYDFGQWRVAFFRGPEGHLVELIGPQQAG